MSDHGRGHTLTAFLIGGVFGMVLGMLYAPKSGKETREDLSGIPEELGKKIRQLEKEFSEKMNDIRSDAKSVKKTAKDAFSKIKETIFE
jgi:gas vesicle protein